MRRIKPRNQQREKHAGNDRQLPQPHARSVQKTTLARRRPNTLHRFSALTTIATTTNSPTMATRRDPASLCHSPLNRLPPSCPPSSRANWLRCRQFQPLPLKQTLLTSILGILTRFSGCSIIKAHQLEISPLTSTARLAPQSSRVSTLILCRCYTKILPPPPTLVNCFPLLLTASPFLSICRARGDVKKSPSILSIDGCPPSPFLLLFSFHRFHIGRWKCLRTSTSSSRLIRNF